MQVRQSCLEDFNAYKALREASILSLAGTHYTSAQLQRWASGLKEDKVKKLFEKSRFFVGETTDNIMTCAGLWQGHELEYFYVSPAFSRQGWGRYLLSCIEKDYREKTGNASIRTDASDNARAFYEANGYIFLSAVKSDDYPIDTYSLMEKRFAM